MPGMDRTGPMGDGPMTGGGWGRCNPANAGAGLSVVPGWGRRRGFGGRGGGMMERRRGRWWARWRSMPFGFDYPMEPAAEIEMLQAEVETMTKTLNRLNSRIKELQDKKPEP